MLGSRTCPIFAAVLMLWLPNAFSSSPISHGTDPLFRDQGDAGAVIDSVTPAGIVSLPIHTIDPDSYFRALAERYGQDLPDPSAHPAGAPAGVPETPAWLAYSMASLVFGRDRLPVDEAERIVATLMARERERQEQRRRRGSWRTDYTEKPDHGGGHHIELELEQKHKSKKDKQAEKDDGPEKVEDGAKVKDGKHDVQKDKQPVEKDKKPVEKDKQPFDKNRVNVSADSQRLVRDKKAKDKDGKRDDYDEDRKRLRPDRAAG